MKFPLLLQEDLEEFQMIYNSDETSNKRDFQEDEVEDFSFNTNKRVRFEELNKEPIKEVMPARYPLKNPCPEGL